MFLDEDDKNDESAIQEYGLRWQESFLKHSFVTDTLSVKVAGVHSEPVKEPIPEAWQRPWHKVKKSTYARPNDQILRNIDLLLDVFTLQNEINKAVEFQPRVGYYAKGNGVITWKGYDYEFNHIGQALCFMTEIMKTGEIESWVHRIKVETVARETPLTQKHHVENED